MSGDPWRRFERVYYPALLVILFAGLSGLAPWQRCVGFLLAALVWLGALGLGDEP